MNSSGDDFLPYLGFQLDCINSVEQQNLYKAATPAQRRRGVDPPKRPLLAILNEFMLEKIKRVAKDEPLKAQRAISELKWVLEDLVKIGHPEFKEAIERIEELDRRAIEKMRKQLVADYRDPDTSPEDRAVINKTLVIIIENGAWPTWREDVDSWGRDDGCAA
jgi:hypothetical protein